MNTYVSSEADKQRLLDLILFCGIGDGYISPLDPVRNSTLDLTHSVDQLEYVEWKVNLLQEAGLEFGKPYYRKDKKDVRFRSQRHELCTVARKRLYKDRTKVITNRILRRQNLLGLTIWFCDDGSYTKVKPKWRKSLYNTDGRPECKISQFKLNTQSFSEAENDKIIQWFKEQIGLSWSKAYYKGYYLTLNGIDQLDKFKCMMAEGIPDCMKYKIEHPTKFTCQKRLNETAPQFEGDATVQI